MVDDENPKEYRWETGYEKTWEAIKEDDDGLLDSAIAEILAKTKKQKQEKSGHNQLGIMRYLYLIIDCSEAMNLPDLKPTRFQCTIKLLEKFIEEFFDQNPISQLGIITMKNKRAEKLIKLTGSERRCMNAVQRLSKMTLSGEPSLQNGLEMALQSLKSLPAHISKEILIILASLTTCDAIDINITVGELKEEGIRCSIISLSAEIRVCRFLTQETKGKYCAVLDDSHYHDQLSLHINPPPIENAEKNCLIKMGFPHAIEEERRKPLIAMCICHLENINEPAGFSTETYTCPQCISRYCEIPVECITCGLTLVSAPHLARSYHHIFPPKKFSEIIFREQVSWCFSCLHIFNESNKLITKCDDCQEFFCSDCDFFIHEILNFCVGCTVNAKHK